MTSQRWRLVLGEAAQPSLGSLDATHQGMDDALSWLYDRDPGFAERETANRQGSLGPSNLTIPDWIDKVHRLFPKETIERLEKDAVEKYQIQEVVTHPEVLKRAEPNPTLLQAVLRTKHLMNEEVLALARELVAKVVQQLMEKFAKEIRVSFSGTRDRRRRSLFKSANNLDAKATLRRNLAHYDPIKRQLFIERPIFMARTKRHTDKWQVILLVDESGSMIPSVIHAAVTAACLWGLPSIRTHLVIFDTEVVDLTEDCTDPVEVLMKVQLGGGTDIGKAVRYGAELVENPRKSIVVLITDFCEGASGDVLVQQVKQLVDSGVVVLGLAALDPEGVPAYDRDMAQRLVNVGAHVGAMTPGELANFIASKVAS